MKHFYLGLGILVVILGASLLHLWNLDRQVARTTQELQIAYEAVSRDQIKTAAEHARTASQCWRAQTGYYSSFLSHEESDEVTRQFARMLSSLEAEDIDDFQAACGELIIMVDHLSQMEKPLYYNLL